MEKLFCVKEVSEKLGVHIMTIYRLISSKKLPASKIGGQWRVDPTLLKEWVLIMSNQI